jgi:hypothetical protein
MRHTIHNVQRSYIKVQKPFFSYHPSKGGGGFLHCSADSPLLFLFVVLQNFRKLY